MVRTTLAVLAALDGDAATARTEILRAAHCAWRSRDMPVVAGVVAGAAVVAEVVDGDLDRAARLLGTADTVRGRPDRANLDAEALARRLRERLGAERFAELTAAGAAVPREQALDAVLGGS